MRDINHDRILIRDLTLLCFVGIHDQERQARQRVISNIVLDVKRHQNASPESIEDVVCYEKITNKIKVLANEKHHVLLEELAERIAVLCLGDPRVKKARIRLEKPDIMEGIAVVGVEITRFQTE